VGDQDYVAYNQKGNKQFVVITNFFISTIQCSFSPYAYFSVVIWGFLERIRWRPLQVRGSQPYVPDINKNEHLYKQDLGTCESRCFTLASFDQTHHIVYQITTDTNDTDRSYYRFYYHFYYHFNYQSYYSMCSIS